MICHDTLKMPQSRTERLNGCANIQYGELRQKILFQDGGRIYVPGNRESIYVYVFIMLVTG